MYKSQQNNRNTCRYTKWYPITRNELYKMFAVIIAMGIDYRPNLYDYWSMDTLTTHCGIMNFFQWIDSR